jgi:hypothetical protein
MGVGAGWTFTHFGPPSSFQHSTWKTAFSFRSAPTGEWPFPSDLVGEAEIFEIAPLKNCA